MAKYLQTLIPQLSKAVVRAEVCYGDPPTQEYRDLWVIRFAGDGRCTWFEEWPYWPEKPHAEPDDPA